ncbi:MAG: hypothetical protein ACP5KV_05045 [Candidatus Methanomethylicaceae archaeon]
MERIRDLNKVVDITKGTLQIMILLTLKNSKKPMTLQELSRCIGRRKKSINDAILKLKNKGLINKIEVADEATYVVTEQGIKYINELVGLFNSGDPDYDGPTVDLAGTVDLLPLFFYTYDAIVSLGMARESGLSLKKIASIFGLSLDRTETYMDLFIDAPGAKLFRKETGGETRYYLTKEGMRVFNQLSYCFRSKNRYLMKFLSLITRSTHPKTAYSRLSIVLGAGSLITSAYAVITGSIISCLIWISFIVFLGTLTGLDSLYSYLSRK